ncbi:Rrf2 family transcriptional regulator [Heyndrickxia sp. NPDC080065]|uniref:Rrf2 family transcriptional regulator n=1 Tax=Heyndrickxia sp. NPDC080065 TaxID=3390568 RepID=UPI003D018BB6
MINTRFAVAIHILSLVASTKEREKLTSDWIAASVNTNPVVIRRISGMLKKAGLLESQVGIPGSILTKLPSNITLLEVYKAVQPKEELFALHDKPNPECPVGKRIQSTLDDVFHSIQTEMESKLASQTLQDVLDHLFQ